MINKISQTAAEITITLPLYHFTSLHSVANYSKHTLPPDVILRRTTISQLILPLSGPHNAHRFSSETLALYKYQDVNIYTSDFYRTIHTEI